MRSLSPAVVLLLVLSACGGDSDSAEPQQQPTDMGFATVDLGVDAVVDSGGQPDATTLPEDTGVDGGVDGGFDASADGGLDASADGGLDASADGGFDAGVDTGVVVIPDVGVDTGVAIPDVGVDTGIVVIPDVGVDGGVDVGFPDAGFADAGTGDSGVPRANPALEGVACTSSFTVTATVFARDNCAAGHLCVPWDTLSGDPRLNGPVQSCVRPCATDADCGQNANGSSRHCVESGFVASTGAGRICVDSLARPDQFCGFSRLSVSRIAGVQIQTPGQMIGCGGGTTCQTSFFTDVHVDEGVCLSLCSVPSDCPASLPYCNPDVFGATPSIGVCSDIRRGLGSLCGSSNPADLGITTRCDTSTNTPANTTCIPGSVSFVGLDLPTGLGQCATLCNSTSPCGSDPVRGPMTCSSLFLTQGTTTFGLCGTGCSNYPEDCGGTGSRGAGRFCTPAAAPGAQFCADIQPPVLAAGQLVGGVPSAAGDNCLTGTSVLSCPEGSTCYQTTVAPVTGRCFYGCSRTAGAANVCNGFLGTTTATCASVPRFLPAIGLCE